MRIGKSGDSPTVSAVGYSEPGNHRIPRQDAGTSLFPPHNGTDIPGLAGLERLHSAGASSLTPDQLHGPRRQQES
jgi:hypothetical protein